MRRYRLAIILTALVCFSKVQATPIRCVDLFSAATMIDSELRNVAHELADLEVQLSEMEVSAVRLAVSGERGRIFREFLEQHGETQTQLLKELIHERRRSVILRKEADRVEVNRRAKQVQNTLLVRQDLHTLPDVSVLGPFLNKHQFFTNALGTTHTAEKGELALFDLRTNSFARAYSNHGLRDAVPIGLSPNSDLVYLFKDSTVISFNRLTRKITARRKIEPVDQAFSSVVQSADRSRIFLTSKTQSSAGPPTTGHILKVSPLGEILPEREIFLSRYDKSLVESPDGRFMYKKYGDEMIYQLVDGQKILLPITNNRGIINTEGAFSADSKKLLLVTNPRGGNSVKILTWEMSRQELLGQIPLKIPVGLMKNEYVQQVIADPKRDDEALLVTRGAAGDGGLYTLDAVSGQVAEFQFKTVPEEKLTWHLLTQDRKKLFLLTQENLETSGAPDLFRLYELDLASRTVVANSVKAETWTLNDSVSPDGQTIFFSLENKSGVQILR